MTKTFAVFELISSKKTTLAFVAVYVLSLVVAGADYAIRVSGTPFAPSAPSLIGIWLSSSVSALMLASVVLMAGRLFHIVVIPLCWAAVCLGIEVFLLRYCPFGRGAAGEDFLVSLVTLSWPRVCHFAEKEMSAMAWTAVGISLLAVVSAIAWMISMDVPRTTFRRFLAGVVLFGGLSFVLPYSAADDHFSMAVFDHQFLLCVSNAPLYCNLRDAGRTLPDGTYVSSESNLVAVVVIGESSTRFHWSLYGYDRETTPGLDRLASELIVFSNAVSTVGFTPYALRDLFTVKTDDGSLSVPSAAHSAGYDSVLISGQARRGPYQGSGELLFASCHERKYADEIYPFPVYDNSLVPMLRESLADSESNCVRFVHMYGSHTPCDQRTPQSFKRYSSEYVDSEVARLDADARRLVNEYDNSIIFTDSVLCGMIELLRETGRPVVFIYVSDHGESPSTFARDMKSEKMYAIPAFVWASPGYRRTHVSQIERLGELAAQPLTSRDFFPILMDLLGLERK